MTEHASATDRRHPLGGLLTAQFFGAFNDNAMKLMVALLAGTAAAAAVEGTAAKESAQQTQTTIAFVVFTLPLMLFSLPSALLADRFSKRTIVLWMKALEIVLMAAGTAVLWVQPQGGAALMALLAAMGLQSAIFSPAKYGIMPELCDEATISKGNGLLEMWTFLAIIAGSASGGALLRATHGREYLAMGVLVVLAVVGLVAAFAVPRVRPAASDTAVTAQLAGAWAAIRGGRTLRLVILGQTVFWTLVSLLGQDVLTYARVRLGLDEQSSGLTFAAFGLGIGVGSVWAGRISNHRIEPGLIPFGAIGIAVGTTVLGAVTPGFAGTMLLMVLLGVASGLVVVPLEALLQWHAPRDKVGAVIAIANVPVFFGVMIGSLAVYFLAIVGGYSSAAILTIAGLLTIAATVWAIWLLPQALARMAVLLLTQTLYRLRVVGAEHLPARGGALLVANHVSLVDWLFLVSSCERPIRFLVDSGYYHKALLRPVMKAIGAIPISAGSPRELMRAMKSAGQYLHQGEVVCIFAEGEITRTGRMLPFRRGLTRILKGNDVPVIPVHLDQVWGSPFSSKGGGFLRSWNGPLPRPITLSFGAPLPASAPVAEIRAQVKLLEEAAWRLRQERRPPLHHTLVRVCRRRPFRMAIADSGGKRIRCGQVVAGALLLARRLRTAWQGQERVGILLPPTVGCALTNVAAALSGRVSVNLNYTVGVAAMRSAVQQAELRTVVTSKVFLERAGITLPEELTVVLLEDVLGGVGVGERVAAWLRAMLLPVRMLERAAFAIRAPQVTDPVTVIFSSGSTGEPKGVVLSHANIDANSEAAAQVLGVGPRDRLLGVLPQFHSFGYMALWFALDHGLSVVCHTNPVDAATIGTLVEKERITVLIATPTFLQVYLRRCTPGQFGSLRLVITGAERLPPATADAFEDRFGIRPLQGYGTSECAPVIAVGTAPFRAPGMFQAGSKRDAIGQALPGVALRVVDPETFAPRAPGEPGLLLVRGPNVMLGYLGREDATAAAMRDGWYVTGDIASVDEDGYLRITDRMARFSKIGGEM
ncbi:MAG: MFS transporter, partial [Planctomycetes bacterium]|nr:MFS transporter [Planctomycetota bacterium]